MKPFVNKAIDIDLFLHKNIQMKKTILLIIPLMILSCKKEAVVSDISQKDSSVVSELPSPQSRLDSANMPKSDSLIKKDSVNKELVREEKDKVIVITKDGSGPFKIDEEFTDKHDKLILKIVNFNKSKITAKITTKQQDFNIRFNQIKLPDGKMDGPFMREITYNVPTSGELWLIIGKNNMADGKITGSFSVNVE